MNDSLTDRRIWSGDAWANPTIPASTAASLARAFAVTPAQIEVCANVSAHGSLLWPDTLTEEMEDLLDTWKGKSVGEILVLRRHLPPGRRDEFDQAWARCRSGGGEADEAGAPPVHRSRHKTVVPEPVEESGGITATRLGKYLIGEALYRDGMAASHRARNLDLQCDVEVLTVANADPAQFEREAATMARGRHPGVVQVYDFVRDAGGPFLVLELVDGPRLEQVIHDPARHGLPAAEAADGKGGLAPETAARLLAEIAGAVQAIHDAGVIHRDLKPRNVVLDRRGRPRVRGFQCATLAGSPFPEGVVAGTPAYMSPEQAAGGEVDCRTDVYLLGGMLFEMLTGRRPREGGFPAELLIKATDEDARSPREFRPGVDRALERVCLQAMARKPEDRYASAAALAGECRDWAERVARKGLRRRLHGAVRALCGR